MRARALFPWLLLLALLGLPAGARAAEGPFFSVGRDGTLVVSGLPGILSRPEVKPHLSTGLTTTFSLRITATDETGQKVRGGGRIDVRWEPWDEVFLTMAMGADGRVHRDSLPSQERLQSWWHALEIPAAAGLAPAGHWEVKVELSVIPFSASEQRDTQRWLSDSLSQPAAPSTGQEAPSVASRQAGGGGGVLDLLLATSIKRRSLANYAWRASAKLPEHRKGGAA